MTMCNKCKKYPLTMGECNEVLDDKGREVTLCDECHKEWYKSMGRPV